MIKQRLNTSHHVLYSHKTYCVTKHKIHNILWSTLEGVVFAIFVATNIALISLAESLDQYILGGF